MRASGKDTTANQLEVALKATEIRLRRSKPDRDGLVSSYGEGTLSVELSPANIPRAMGVLRRLAEQLASQGIALEPRRGGTSGSEDRVARRCSSVLIDGCRVYFRIREAWKLVPYEWTADDHRTFDRSGYAPYQKTSRKLTGELCFVIDGYNKAKSLWKDGKRRGLLGEQVPGIVDGLVAVAAERREWEASRRKHEAEYRARAEKEWEASRAREEKRRRFEVLLQRTIAWRQAQEIHDFVSALRDAAREELDAEAVERVEQWAEDANALIEELSPMAQVLGELAQPEGN